MAGGSRLAHQYGSLSVSLYIEDTLKSPTATREDCQTNERVDRTGSPMLTITLATSSVIFSPVTYLDLESDPQASAAVQSVGAGAQNDRRH